MNMAMLQIARDGHDRQGHGHQHFGSTSAGIIVIITTTIARLMATMMQLIATIRYWARLASALSFLSGKVQSPWPTCGLLVAVSDDGSESGRIPARLSCSTSSRCMGLEPEAGHRKYLVDLYSLRTILYRHFNRCGMGHLRRMLAKGFEFTHPRSSHQHAAATLKRESCW